MNGVIRLLIALALVAAAAFAPDQAEAGPIVRVLTAPARGVVRVAVAVRQRERFRPARRAVRFVRGCLCEGCECEANDCSDGTWPLR